MPARKSTDQPGRLAAGIDDLTQVIEQLLAPYEEQLQQAESMPGWARRAAQDAIAVTGAGMSRFRTGAHLVSRAGPSTSRAGSCAPGIVAATAYGAAQPFPAW